MEDFKKTVKTVGLNQEREHLERESVCGGRKVYVLVEEKPGKSWGQIPSHKSQEWLRTLNFIDSKSDIFKKLEHLCNAFNNLFYFTISDLFHLLCQVAAITQLYNTLFFDTF